MDNGSNAADETVRVAWPGVALLVYLFFGLILGLGFILMSPPTLGGVSTGVIYPLMVSAAVVGFLLYIAVWAVTRDTINALPFEPFVICYFMVVTMLWAAVGFWGGNMWLPLLGRPEVEAIELPVVGKTVQQSRRGRINYLIVTLDPFDNWRPTTIKTRPLFGGRQHWERFAIGQCAELRFRMGHFGMPIRDGFDPKPCSPIRGTAVVTDRVTVNLHPAKPAAWRWVESHENSGSNSELSP